MTLPELSLPPASGVPEAQATDAPPEITDPTVALDGQVRQATLELLRYGLLEQVTKPNLYRTVVTHLPRIGTVLANLDLRIRIDDIRGLAYLAVAERVDEETDEWSHPLVRKQRLTLEQSLLVAILRQQFIAHEIEAGVGASDAQVDIDDLLPHLQAYLGFLGSDQQERKRMLGLLEQLKGHGLVSDIDQQERVTIRPIIAHLANPENLLNLMEALKHAAGTAVDGDASGDAGEAP